MWTDIIAALENNQNFVLTAHINPDCDALGSELALDEHLRNLGKNVAILNNDATPATFHFLDPGRRAKRYTAKKHKSLIKKADAIIVLDASGGWERMGKVGETFKQLPALKLCIDHHPDPSDFVDVAVIDTGAAATAELIFELIQTMRGNLSEKMAQALYAGLTTDTGGFRFPKTSPRSHKIAAALLAAGADPLKIHSQIYQQDSLGVVRLRGAVMESIQLAGEGQIAYYAVTRANLKKYDVKSSQLDGFAGLGQQVGGVRIAIFCMETANSKIKISLRSDGSVPVNKLALAYNGGGHPSAAGALTPGKLAEIMAEVVGKAEVLLAENDAP